MKIPVSQPALVGNEKKYVIDCLDSNWISSKGKYIHLFEQKFAEYLGVKHALSCCNGTTALHLSLLALGIGAGDEVIVPTFTYVATANAVAYTGATPVLVDCEPDTWNIDPLKIEALVTARTKAIIPVPLYGHPCDMNPILDVAQRYGLYVVEDAAEALGARYKESLCGSMAKISTFSLYGNKTITTGEGGMLVTNDDELAAKVRLFKGQGMAPNRQYWFSQIGYNYRMTNIQAAIGLAQLENIELFLAKRREIAGWYKQHLSGIPGITLPVIKKYASHSWWMYSILIENEYGESRDTVIYRLSEDGIESRPFFYPMHVMPVYSKGGAPFKIATAVASKGINLPTYYDLCEQDIVRVASVLRDICK
ncbi:MAG: DegT/DnrJ/EryC1/StrS family aminotransferase [Geobacteraceae bacterium]|nr:DegT/DnrJ/EryC1/StrS family aminotransferase [Geobacteraceae bacterium]